MDYIDGTGTIFTKLAEHVLAEITKQLSVYALMPGDYDDSDFAELANVHWVLVADCNLRGPMIHYGGMKVEDVAEYMHDQIGWADRNEVATEAARKLMKARWPWLQSDIDFIPLPSED